MRKKIFAILLALCMVLTMMPTMAWAEGTDPEPVKLYAIWSDAKPENGIITTSDWADQVDIPVDGVQGVKYLGYTVEDTSSENREHTFTILENPRGDYGDLVISEKNEDNEYLLRFAGEISDGDKQEKVIPNKKATITTTPDGTSYELNYRVTVPYLGAYKAPEINFTNLLMGEDLSYDDLASVYGTDAEKAIYFMVNVEPGETVENICLAGDYSDNIPDDEIFFYAATESKPAYLEVRVKDEILFEEIHVVAQIQTTEGKGFSDNRYFRIHGNVMYRLFLDGEKPGIEKFVQTENIDDRIYLEPGETQTVVLGLPAEQDEKRGYRIVSIAGTNEIACSQVEDKGEFRIQATENARVGQTYYLSYSQDEKIYRIPVEYGFPGIGAYSDAVRDAEHLLNGSTISYDDEKLQSQEDSKVIYFITNDNHVTNMTLEGVYDNQILNATFVEANGDKPAHLKVTVDSSIVCEEFDVIAEVTWEDNNIDNWRYSYTIANGNLINRLFLNENSNLQFNDCIQTDDFSNQFELSPKVKRISFFGIPTKEENVHQIVEITGASDEISYERLNSKNGAYRIWANENAVPGKWYFLQAEVGSKTYKIPVKYNYAFIGFYKSPNISEESCINSDNIYNEAKEQGCFYLISGDENIASMEISEEGLPEGLEVTESGKIGDDIPYLKITIDYGVFEEGNFRIVASFKDSGWEPYECEFGLSKYYEPEEENQDYRPVDDTLLICTKDVDTYQTMPLRSSDDGSLEEAAQFFLREHADRTFYVLYKENAKTLTLPLLNHYRDKTGNIESGAEVRKLKETTYNDQTYYVWEVKVKGDFTGMSRVGFSFDGGEPVTYGTEEYPRTKFMWILGDKYLDAENNTYSDGNIIVCDTMPTVGAKYDGWDAFVSAVGELGAGEERYYCKALNMSAQLSDNENALYILHPAGTSLHDNSYVAHSYGIDGSGFGRGGLGGDFDEELTGDIYGYTSAGSIELKGQSMQVTKATLKSFYGHNGIVSDFYLTDASERIHFTGFAEVYLEKGMNVVIDGPAEDVVTIDSDVNIVNHAVGIEEENPLKFVKDADGRYKAFYDIACAQISDEGYGRWINFNVNLKPGYVVEKITDKAGNNIAFCAERNFFYDSVK